MIPRSTFKTMVKQKLIASVRVVPVPMETTWCIDAIIRMPLEAGSTTDTISRSGPSDKAGDGLRRFRSIDEAARFLKETGISTFTVDTRDSITFAGTGTESVRYVERSVQVWDDDETGDAMNNPVA
jgi:hypothetical protein